MSHALNYPPLLMPAPDAAHYLGISPTTLRGLNIPRKMLGAKRLFDKRDLDAFANDLPYEGDKQEKVNSCDAAFGMASD
ncbi:MAG: DNA-binding protein [Robiginitomaculum sp.]|nr:MAG: DNA-binding protein [Robiginitomaculum sp.]